MRFLASICVFLVSINLSASVVSVSPQDPVLIFVNRYVSNVTGEFYAPNTMLQIAIDNSKSKYDLVISDIAVETEYDMNGFQYAYTTKNVIATNVSPSGELTFVSQFGYVIPAGQKQTLGNRQDTWFLISNMIGLNSDFYFGNYYGATIGSYFQVILVGYYINQSGLPVENFKDSININIK